VAWQAGGLPPGTSLVPALQQPPTCVHLHQLPPQAGDCLLHVAALPLGRGQRTHQLAAVAQQVVNQRLQAVVGRQAQAAPQLLLVALEQHRLDAGCRGDRGDRGGGSCGVGGCERPCRAWAARQARRLQLSS
jgi:hypothetical protein